MYSLNYGTLPSKKVFADKFQNIDSELFTLGFNPASEDFKLFVAAVNIGIDSHLEAIRFIESCNTHHRVFKLDCDSLYTLVRRLIDSGDNNSLDLAASILQTLDIEWF